MNESEIDPIASAAKGVVSGALEGFFARKDAKAAANKVLAPALPIVRSTLAINPNWVVEPLLMNREKRILLYCVVKTSSAVVSDLKISRSFMSPEIRFYGDTEWPGEIGQNEPLFFMVGMRPFGEFGKPEVTLEWVDANGNKQDDDFRISLTGSAILDSY
ncbi:hypothetical protein [Leucobacter sp. 1207-22]|uniref:hypothetical protein n=1 Tax=Leucobacter sp. 1207-22 TaxID=2604456 RepID=UPI00406365AA